MKNIVKMTFYLGIYVAGILVILYAILHVTELKLNRYVRHLTKNKIDLEDKTVILWTTHYGKTAANISSHKTCRLTRNYACRLTSDRNHLHEASGVIFFVWPGDWNGSKPSKRFFHQYYLGYTFEPATHGGYRSKRFKSEIVPTISEAGFFNLTATFRSDSSIPSPYLYSLHGNYQLPNLTEILTGKKKLVAWYVSHCNTSSKREKYAKELSRYIQLDIYGLCGSQHICKRETNKTCNNDILEDYKFYFAAENAICKDYFTEKLYRPLSRFVVPLVYGADEVYKVAPPNSYIDVRNFSSAKKLADYLMYLHHNEQAYMSYFYWRKHYKVVRGNTHYGKVFCDLCRMLHENKKNSIVPNFYKWYFNDSGCRDGDIPIFEN